MALGYPTSFETLTSWAKANSVLPSEARVRFAQYCVLAAIASSRSLSAVLVLKGGNALDFVWLPNRSTQDLDFSVDMPGLADPLSESRLKTQLQSALDGTTRAFGVILLVQRVRQHPPGPDRSFVTFEVTVGYALPDEQTLVRRIEAGIPSSRTVRLEISVNEPICDSEPIDIGIPNALRVCTIEDILAEKLRAYLQQSIRDRHRRQDLLDIAVILGRFGGELDRGTVTQFLLTKAAARDVPVTRSAFLAEELANRAAVGYEELQKTTREEFVPFDIALSRLHELVDQLQIPD